MAYKRKTHTSYDGVKRTVTVNDGNGRAKTGTRNTSSIQTGKGSGYSQRTATSVESDGRIRRTVTTNLGGWITRRTNITPKLKPLKKRRLPRKGTFARKIHDGVQSLVFFGFGIFIFVAFLHTIF